MGIIKCLRRKEKSSDIFAQSFLDGNIEVVDVKIDEPLYEHLDQWLETDRYVKLDNEPLVTDIKKSILKRKGFISTMTFPAFYVTTCRDIFYGK